MNRLSLDIKAVIFRLLYDDMLIELRRCTTMIYNMMYAYSLGTGMSAKQRLAFQVKQKTVLVSCRDCKYVFIRYRSTDKMYCCDVCHESITFPYVSTLKSRKSRKSFNAFNVFGRNISTIIFRYVWCSELAVVHSQLLTVTKTLRRDIRIESSYYKRYIHTNDGRWFLGHIHDKYCQNKFPRTFD